MFNKNGLCSITVRSKLTLTALRPYNFLRTGDMLQSSSSSFCCIRECCQLSLDLNNSILFQFVFYEAAPANKEF